MSQTENLAHGIDVGGTGIKGGLVSLETGTLASERFRLDTPHPAHPGGVADTIAAVADNFDFAGPVGAAFPGVVLDGVVKTAANLEGLVWPNPVRARRRSNQEPGEVAEVLNHGRPSCWPPTSTMPASSGLRMRPASDHRPVDVIAP